MKKLFAVVILNLPFWSFCQKEFPEIKEGSDWQKVLITRDPEAVIGLERVSVVCGEAIVLYALRSKLRSKAIEQIKKSAAKKGASITFITKDKFSIIPLDNIKMEGIAYKLKDL